ncbi:hypothetical protein TrLO_g3231 [Triparma laevis f. longispina]|nr:hypothetical protein TrLO_g3231 [Triparma laevis f. longispina]
MCTVCPAGKFNPNTATEAAQHLSCMDCRIGTYLEDDGEHADNHNQAFDCIYCPPGHYSNSTGSNTCKKCPGDQDSPAGASSCSKCPAGFDCSTGTNVACKPGNYSNGETQNMIQPCQQCAKGFRCPGGTDHRPCQPGSYAPNEAADKCTSCPGGTYQGLFGQDQCLGCPAGYFCPGSAVEPIKCGSAALFCPANSTIVQVAGEGNYTTPENSDTPKREDQAICEAGFKCVGGMKSECEDGLTFQKETGKSSCLTCAVCEAGKYKISNCDTISDTECKSCPENTFAVSGATGCTQCPAGAHSQPGSGYCDHCNSGEYYEEDTDECKLCPAGKYTDTGGVGSDECRSCDEGFYSSDPGSATCYTCKPGKFTNHNQTKCLLCPAGKISGVAASKCVACEIGKYAEGEGNPGCNFCDDDEALKGSITLQNGTISASGCICPAGEYVNFGNGDNACKRVPEGVKTNVEAMTVVNLNVSKGFWRTDNSSSKVLPCLSPDHCLGGSNPEDQCKEGHTGPLCAICNDGYASTGSGMFLKCSNCEEGDPVTTIIFVVFVFFFFTFLMITLSSFCCSKTKDSDSLASNSVLLHSKIDSFLEFYVQARPFGKIVLSYFQVVGALSFNFDIEFPPFFTMLMTYISSIVNLDFLNMLPVGCVMSSFNYHHTLLIYTLVPFLIGFNMIVAYLILRKKGKIAASNAIFSWFLFMMFLILPSVSSKILNTFACRYFDGSYGSFLKVDYSIDCASDDHVFYEAYAKLCILIYPLGIPTFYVWLLRRARKSLNPGQKHMEKRYGVEDGLKRAIEERERLEEERLEIRSLAFLYDSYEPKYFWFEVVETVRKLMLSGGLVLLGPGTMEQIIVSLMICLASIRIFSGCEPYIEYKVDVFMEMSQWQIFFVMFAALLIRFNEVISEYGSENAYTENKGLFDVILIATQCLAPAVLVMMVLFRGRDIVSNGISRIKSKMTSLRSRSRLKDENGAEDESEEGGMQLTEFKGGVVVLGQRPSEFEGENPVANPLAKGSTKRSSQAMKVDSKNSLLAVAKPKPAGADEKVTKVTEEDRNPSENEGGQKI